MNSDRPSCGKCGQTNCRACFPQGYLAASGWIYWTPQFPGNAPAGYEASPAGWVVEYTNITDPGSYAEWEVTDWPVWIAGGRYRLRRREDAETATAPDPKRTVSLPEDDAERLQYPVFDGFMAYFPNAMAEVAKLSWVATQQHHPDEAMHWDRSKSLDHKNKIARHLIDAGKIDSRGQRHSAMVAWRAMALLQEELERDLGLPPSPASRNRPEPF